MHRLRFVLLFAAVHAALSGLAWWGAGAAAAARAAAGATPTRFDLLLLTANGVLLAPVFTLMGRTPAAAGLFPGGWAAIPIAANSLLWGAALGWVFARLAGGGRRGTGGPGPARLDL
jgi:hypothetical protein